MIRDFIRRAVNNIYALMKKEFITIWNDPKSRAIIVMMPIMQLLIFSNAATMEVRNIDTVVLDRSQSVESRELLSRFENSRQFRTFYYVGNEKEFRQYLDTQKAQLGINIPNDFARGIKSKTGANVQIISDGRQTNSAAIGTGYASQIINLYNAELTGNKDFGLDVTVRNRFNPNLEYKWYILTIIVAMLSLVTTLILTSLSIARER